MDTRSDRTVNYVPINILLRGAGLWLGSWVAIAAQDVAGLSYSKAIPYSYRLPAKLLCYFGAIFLVWLVLARCEKRLNGSTSANVPKIRRAGAIVLGALCIAIPSASFLVSELFLQ